MNEKTKIDKFLSQFFGPSQKFRWEEINNPESKLYDLICPWIGRLYSDTPTSTVLPRWHLSNEIEWYAISFSQKQMRELRDNIIAFVGPSYSTFRGHIVHSDPLDSIEQGVKEFTDGNYFKFSTPSNTKDKVKNREIQEKLRKTLELMCIVWKNRPPGGLEINRPTGDILREFGMALLAGNQQSARETLRFLSENYRLDAVNLCFLEVQLYERFQEWDEIIRLCEYNNLLYVRRTPAVTRSIIRAIYQKEIKPFENDDINSLIMHFREKVHPQYNLLFKVRGKMTSPEVLKCFMLKAVSIDPTDPALCDEILSITDLDKNDLEFLKKIAGTLKVPDTEDMGDSLVLARESLLRGDFERTFGYAVKSPSNKEQVSILLNCAFEIQTLESKQIARQAFDSLTPSDQKILLKTRTNRNFHDYTCEDKEETIPGDWLSWIQFLSNKPNREKAIEIARQGTIEWSIKDFLAQPGKIFKMNRLLNDLTPESEEIVYNALPYFVEFFQDDIKWPRKEFTEIYQTLQLILAGNTRGGRDDLEVFNSLAEIQLILGISEENFKDIIVFGKELIDEFGSPILVDWILDLMELFIIYPTPAKCADLKIDFLIAGICCFRKCYDRIRSEQWKILESICRDLNQNEIFLNLRSEKIDTKTLTKDSAEGLFKKLDGQKIGIYTLTEQSGRRVQNFLKENCENIKIFISSDKVATDRLKSIAENTDILVIAVASAKHAATGYLKKVRPANKPILIPSGKGSASILREIFNYLEN